MKEDWKLQKEIERKAFNAKTNPNLLLRKNLEKPHWSHQFVAEAGGCCATSSVWKVELELEFDFFFLVLVLSFA